MTHEEIYTWKWVGLHLEVWFGISWEVVGTARIKNIPKFHQATRIFLEAFQDIRNDSITQWCMFDKKEEDKKYRSSVKGDHRNQITVN